MALVPLRGVLIEYGTQFLGPIPNIVVFQFNPEQMTRTIAVPPRRTEPDASGARPQRETDATVGPPVESFSITAHFSAADDLGAGGAVSAIPRLFGVGPQLAALEKMVYPVATPGGLIGAAIDAVGSALSSAGDSAAERPVPRERVPRILFIWGPSRVVPVRITQMSITEKKYDMLLNPVQAEVQIGFAIPSRVAQGDVVGQGAMEYSQMIKDTQATLNLAKVAEFALDIVPF